MPVTGAGRIPVAERIVERLVMLPRMVRYDEAYVDELAGAFVKVLTNLDQLAGRTSDRKLERATTLG